MADSIAVRWFLIWLAAMSPMGVTFSQDELVERKPPPAIEEFETDEEPADGLPDGWYNAREAKLVSPGLFGAKCLKLENDKPSRPARISRAFGVDGSKFSALKISCWVKVSEILPGEHEGETPGILVDFLNADLLTDSRGIIGPFDSTSIGNGRWQFVSRVLLIKPTTLDCIMTLGLLGSTGSLEIDRMSFELIPRDMPSTVNLVPNGDLALGDSRPDGWSIDGNVRRNTTPEPFATSLEMGRGKSRALAGLGRQVQDLNQLSVLARYRSQGLRASGGATISIYFVDDRGSTIIDRPSQALIRIGGSSNSLKESRASVNVPSGAVCAIVQIDKTDEAGVLTLDALEITAAPDAEIGRWTPNAVQLTEDSDEWPEYASFGAIEPGSVLDTTTYGLVIPKPPLKVVKGTLTDADGKPIRLWGVSLLPTASFPEGDRAPVVADLLHRLGANVVRFGDLDLAYGPGISLIDDARDDTSGIDAESFRRMNRFQAELARRGIHYSVELHSNRRFREGDAIDGVRALPPGGGPAAIFDPELTTIIDAFAKKLLTEPRTEKLPKLVDDPYLAWVTMSGEVTMIDAQPDNFDDARTAMLKKLQAAGKSGSTKRFHRDLESARYKSWADSLRSLGLKTPLASLGHWKRDAEFADIFRGPSIDLIEDRYYWPYHPWSQPGYRSALFDPARSFQTVADSKRQPGQAYILGQWCNQSQNAWSLPTEAADVLFGAYSARALNFDGLIRRGLAVHPTSWGANATGTGGDRDIFALPEALNGMPQVLAMMPHAASILRRDRSESETAQPAAKSSAGKTTRKSAIPPREIKGWNPAAGYLRVDTPHTVALAGHIGNLPDEMARFGEFRLEFSDDFGVMALSSASPDPVANSKRLLLTILGRATPTGLKYKDHWQKEVADPGRPPIRVEPVAARFSFTGRGRILVRSVDNSGKAGAFVRPVSEGETTVFELDLKSGGPNWEIELSR